MLVSNSMRYIFHKAHFMLKFVWNFARFAFTLSIRRDDQHDNTRYEIRGVGEKRRGHALRGCVSACVMRMRIGRIFERSTTHTSSYIRYVYVYVFYDKVDRHLDISFLLSAPNYKHMVAKLNILNLIIGRLHSVIPSITCFIHTSCSVIKRTAWNYGPSSRFSYYSMI